jgi:pimeloyl-ACP methyl ester carboxylesterase
MSPNATPPTFVLIHGAWHGGWCWDRVATRLRAAGHRVYAPSLPGLGDQIHRLTRETNLSTHVTEILDLLTREDLVEVVLCGHSYGGAVASVVADRASERIRSLVYLDAFVPQHGESMLDVMLPERRERLEAAAAESATNTVPPIPAAVFRVNERDREWVDRTCLPQPFGTFSEKVQLGGGLQRIGRKTYVRAAGYPNRVFEAHYQRFRRDPSWTVVALECGHDVMLDMPDELAALLERCAVDGAR